VSDADRRASRFLTAITFLRAALAPVIIGLVLVGPRIRYAFAIAATLFAIAALTDFFDGFLARRWAQTTTFGSFLDTTTDKLLVSGALIALVRVGRASPWIAFIIVGRELLILGLRGAVAVGGGVIPPSLWGKLKANAQFIAVALAIARYPHRVGPLFLDQYAMLVAAAVTIGSALEYLSRFAGAVAGPRRA
jgi:CDP-diacylglycerol--glycerol-3-phosphate 3-phosphatidyltransferase